MRRIGRRGFLTAVAAGGAVAAGAALELRSLRGEYDHRDAQQPTAQRAFARALQQLERDLHAPALLHVGHSTHVLALGGKKLLTDPWFHDPAHGGMRHARGPAARADQLGQLDAVLITHEHPDHADPRALDQLDKRAHCIVGTKNLVALCKRLGFTSVTQLRPGETLSLAPLAITATPAVHDIPEVGFAISRYGGPSIYFAGDTAMQASAFEAIKERHAPAAAILPIDGTRLRGDRRWVMTAEEAARAAKLLGTRVAIASHADTVFTDWLLQLWASVDDHATHRFTTTACTRQATCLAPTPGDMIALEA